MDSDNAVNYHSTVLTEPNLMPLGDINIPSPINSSVLRTPFAGNVRSMPPPLPQAPMQMTYGSSPYTSGDYGSGYGGGVYGSSFGGFGGFGSGFGGGYGSYGGYGGYGGAGAYNRFGGGMNPMDPEARFIQLAEVSSRPAFQSIESLVGAIVNIASMLDSTFYALTSSFRALLGVAANFGRLRGVFSQFLQTFAIFRSIKYIYRKILYWLRISNLDPSSETFQKAFAQALNTSNSSSPGPKLPQKGQSPWPVLAFISFICTAPYLMMKLVGTVANTALEETRNPSKWINPIETVALFDFQARNPSELTIRAGDRILIAPKEVQNTQGLLNTGWGLATINGQESGIVPINYVKSPQTLRQEQQQHQIENQMPVITEQGKQFMPSETRSENVLSDKTEIDLSAAAFPAPPPAQTTYSNDVNDFDIANKSIEPPNTIDMAHQEN